MTDINELTELAVTLAHRLKKQTEKWVNAFHQELHNCQEIRKRHLFKVEAALPIVTAFQIVHVMSFIHAKKYIEEGRMGDFINVLTESLYGAPTDNWLKYVRQYQSNKQIDFSEQLCRFCEDVSMALTGSYAGMLYSPGFVGMAKEFLYRDWGIVADHFGDRVTMEECVKSVEAIYNKNST